MAFKSKANWKPLLLPKSILDGPNIDCLIGIEELTDYSVVKSNRTLNKSKEIVVEPKKRKLKKRKRNADEIECKILQHAIKKRRNVFKVEDRNPEETLTTDPLDLLPWENIYVPKEIGRALVEQGFKYPTEIQALSIPAAIKGRRDLLGAAETGSGKTLAFGIPIIYGIMKNLQKTEVDSESPEDKLDDDPGCESPEDKLDDDPGCESPEDKLDDDPGCEIPEDSENLHIAAVDQNSESGTCRGKLWALVLTPTRELAIQIKQHLEVAAKYTPIKVAVLVGGMSSEKQERLLAKRPHIVVATPGRLWELLSHPHLSEIQNIRFLAIDETDRMLEREHFPELRNLLEKINIDSEIKKLRQNFVFSATLTFVHEPPKHLKNKNKKVQKLTPGQKLQNIMFSLGITNPKTVDLTKQRGTVEKLTESKVTCSLQDKDVYLYYFLIKHPGRTLVFSNSISCVRRLTSLFGLLKVKPLPLHAEMHQRQRLKNLDRFKEDPKGLLLATDVAARGLDIPNVQHVIHFQVPRTSESYIHRSGRTARAEKEGLTLLLVEPAEMKLYTKLCISLSRSDDLPEFPVDQGTVKRVREIVKCAREIDLLELSLRKVTSALSWVEDTAKKMDIILDDDELPSQPDSEVTAKNKNKIKRKKKQLCELLASPLITDSDNKISAMNTVKSCKKKSTVKVFKSN